MHLKAVGILRVIGLLRLLVVVVIEKFTRWHLSRLLGKGVKQLGLLLLKAVGSWRMSLIIPLLELLH